MKSRKQIILTLALGMSLGLSVPVAATAAERVPDVKDIAAIAKTASTPAEHARVAKQYLTRAQALETKADKLERELRASASNRSAMDQKWPAMMNGMREKKEQNVMQARRAANESRELAEHHSRLAGRTLEQIAQLD